MKEKLVVIGNGMVGARLVEDVIARGGHALFDIVVFGDEPYGNYNRILLSSVLVGSHEESDIFLNPLDWYRENGVTLRAGERVECIDRERRVVVSAAGEVPYDKLVIATGSTPFLPPIAGLRDEAGSLARGAFVFRTLDDARAMIDAAAAGPRAVVIGGGLLGLEAARGLHARGAKVDVLHLTPHLMEMQLDASAGSILQRALEEAGLQIRTNASTERVIVEEGRVAGVALAGGEVLPCELLVVTAGIRPNTALAKAAGLGVRRGVLVGDDLATDDPAIFALGECAEHAGVTYGLVAPLWEQAQVLAERLTGARRDAKYQGSQTHTKLKVAEVELAVMGERDARDADDEVVTYAEPSRGVYKKVILRGGRIAGAMLLGDASRAADLFQTFSRRAIVAQRPSELFFPAGAPANVTKAADLPSDAQICNCNGVSKGTIVQAIAGGAKTLRVLCDRTRAGLGCGACKDQVKALLEDSGAPEDPSVHWYTPAIPMTKPDLVAAVQARGLRSVSATIAALGNGTDEPASKPALASLLRTVWGSAYEDERDARFINDRVHANIQHDGTFSVVPRIYGGVVSPDELRRIADVADRYGAKMVKVTGGQRLDLLGIPKENLPDVWRELGMPSGHAYAKAVRTVKTCVGTDFCRYGVGDSIGLGIAIERKLQGIETPHKVKLATAGCPRNCSEATTKDIGAVAIEGGRWEIHVGGGAGSKVRKADILCVVSTHAEVLQITARFLQFYRENARYLERTYDLVERLGIEAIRVKLADDAARLDAAIDAEVGAYRDPWEEADAPRHASQFTSVVRRDESDVDLVKEHRRAG